MGLTGGGCKLAPETLNIHDEPLKSLCVQGEMPPTAKQYMEAVAARLLIRNLHLALPSLLPRLTNYVHRHARSCMRPV